MKIKLFAIRDIKAESFYPPFTSMKESIAIRQIVDWVRRDDSSIARHPSDHELYYVGEFDQSRGNVSGDVPVFVGGVQTLWDAFEMETEERKHEIAGKNGKNVEVKK